MAILPRYFTPRFAATIVCVFAVQAVSAATPESWRDALLQWRGGSAFTALQRRHYSGDIQVSTLKGTFESWEDAAGSYRMDVHAVGVEFSTRLAQGNGYTITSGGQIEALPTHDTERQLLSMLVGYADVLRGGRGATLSALPPDETADENERGGFRIGFPNGDRYDFYVRPDGELVRCRAVLDGETTVTTFRDWRLVANVRMPGTIESVSSADGQVTVLRVIEEALNPEIPAEVFAKPEAVSRLAFRDGAHGSGPLPFEMFAEQRLFFAGTVGKTETVLLLDSGAEVTVIDVAFARTAGIEVAGHMDIRGVGGTENAAVANNVPVTVGALTFHTGLVVLMDLNQIAQMIGHPVTVILGKEVLNQTVTDIDFSGRMIEFRDPQGFVAPADMACVPLTVAAGIRTVPVNIEGHGLVEADFDLGNGGALLLNPTSAAKWGLFDDRPVAHSIGGGVGGLRAQNVVTVKALEIGGYTLRDLPTETPASAEGLAVFARDSVQGNVGMLVWSRFRLVLDFARNRLFLSATPENLGRAFPKNRAGMTVMRAGEVLKVLFVDPTFPGAVCAAEDEIAAVDGTPVRELRSPNAWTKQSAGTVVELTLKDGHTALLTLQDYY
ncbi:MAG: aspartyl protease family protein [Opitutaceae bacterium]